MATVGCCPDGDTRDRGSMTAQPSRECQGIHRRARRGSTSDAGTPAGGGGHSLPIDRHQGPQVGVYPRMALAKRPGKNRLSETA